MTKKQFLLLKLSEECAEVAQRCSKQIQFGKNEAQLNHDSNAVRLKVELLHLLALVDMLVDEGEIPTISENDVLEAKESKKQKMQKYLYKSYWAGQLPEITL